MIFVKLSTEPGVSQEPGTGWVGVGGPRGEVTDTSHWELNTISGGRGGEPKEKGPRRQMDR